MNEKISPPNESNGSTENRERSLAGKVALITGASRDIGAATAMALGLEGANIVGCFREKAKRADQMQEQLTSLGINLELTQADITVEDDRKKLTEAVNKFGGKLDYLILNASGKTTDINVTAANALIDQFLPIMPKDSTIVQMQSIPGHFEPHLRDLFLTPDFYEPIAIAKYAGEQSVRVRIKEFKEKEINYIVICPPEVPETLNMKVFSRLDPTINDKNSRISEILGLPITMTSNEVGKKIAELLKRNDLPLGYTELFSDNTIDARGILSAWYGDEATFVDTLEKIDGNSGIGKLIVTKEHAKGHFNDQVGISVLPGHKMIEAAAQTLGLIALDGKISDDIMPLFQGITGPIKFLKTAVPGDVLQIQAVITEKSKRGFTGDVRIVNQESVPVAEICGLEAIVTKKDTAKRLMGVK